MNAATSLPPRQQMIDAMLSGNRDWDGIFLTAVKTTGIFCLPSCPARKPKPENVEFYPTAQSALAAGFRPCRRCRPLAPPGDTPDWLQPLLTELEYDPTRRWRDQDIRQLGLNPVTVRRWFLKHHDMTFHAFARMRRLGAALKQIQHGEKLSFAIADHGYESESGFREAFAKVFGNTPSGSKQATQVWLNRINTPLGPMLAGCTDAGVCLLEFMERRMLNTQIQRLRQQLNAVFTPGSNQWTEKLQLQLEDYFFRAGRSFDIPLVIIGTAFQQKVWQALQAIPYGQTCSYGILARNIGQPQAVRAVGKANGDNRIAILIPCHRVVGADGKLTGYGGGLWRKQRLLELEAGAAERQQSRLFA